MSENEEAPKLTATQQTFWVEETKRLLAAPAVQALFKKHEGLVFGPLNERIPDFIMVTQAKAAAENQTNFGGGLTKAVIEETMKGKGPFKKIREVMLEAFDAALQQPGQELDEDTEKRKVRVTPRTPLGESHSR